MAKAKKTSNSTLTERIHRFHKINEQRKQLVKEEEALRAFFVQESGGKEIAFQAGDVEVLVTNESTTRIDGKKLRIDLGSKISKYESTSYFQKVVVREIKQDAA